MKEILRAGGIVLSLHHLQINSSLIVLSAPVSMTINDELIWTSDTGRLMNGLMVGEVVAEKKNISLKWGILTEAEMSQIRNRIVNSFFPVTFRDDGIDMTVTFYRSTLSKEVLGRLSDGIFYYKSATVDLIER